jgi:hypothetical protein
MAAVLINLTPHPIRVFGPRDELVAELPCTATPARRDEDIRPSGELLVGRTSVPLLTLQYGPVLDLPEPRPNTCFVVSRIIADACPDRDDLIVPSDLVRDEHGNPIGCRAFARGATTGQAGGC